MLYKRNGDVFLKFHRKITSLRLLKVLAIGLIIEFSSEFCSSALSIKPFGHSRGFHCELRNCGSTGLLSLKWFSMSFKEEKNILLVHMSSRVCYLGLKVVARLASFTDTIFQYFQGFL